MNKIKILGVVGGLRKDAYNYFTLRAALELVPESTTLSLIELHGIPVFGQDHDKEAPDAVHELKQRIIAADAILFATPEYDYALPGGLKNAIDQASRPYGDSAWLGVPAAILGTSASSLGTARARYHLRQILVALNMPTAIPPEVMIANTALRFAADGRLADKPTRLLIEKLLATLAQNSRHAAQQKGSFDRRRHGTAAQGFVAWSDDSRL